MEDWGRLLLSAMRKASLLDFVEVAEEEEADTGRTATVGISPRLRGLQKNKQKS